MSLALEHLLNPTITTTTINQSNSTIKFAINSNNNNNNLNSISSNSLASSSSSIPSTSNSIPYVKPVPFNLPTLNQILPSHLISNLNNSQKQQQQQIQIHQIQQQQQQQSQRVNSNSPIIPESSFIFRDGTMENSLVPRRRRRTTVEEFDILEVEFKRNPLPTQFERSKIAETIGNISNRAIAVWFQNRRQKEKKDTNISLGSEGSSNGSSMDQDSREELITFSSSPMTPSVLLPITFKSSPPVIPLLSFQSTSNSTSTSKLSRSIELPNLLSSQELYAVQTINKENKAPISPASAVLLPLLNALVDQQRSINTSSTSQIFSKTDNTFIHKSAKTTNVTAKRHVTKRPLGGSAPLARQSSLSHNFDFPASPPKKSRKFEDSTNSINNNNNASNNNNNNNINKQNLLKRKVSLEGLFSLTTNENGRARVWVDSLQKEEMEKVNSEKDLNLSSINSTISIKKDEMWQHMAASDGISPPTSPISRSPIPSSSSNSTFMNSATSLSRKRQLEIGNSIHSTTDRRLTNPLAVFPSSVLPSIFSSSPTSTTVPSTSNSLLATTSSTKLSRRASLTRSHSLGGISITKQSNSTATASLMENSRAGTVESCAEKALSRKRLKMMPTLTNRSRSKSQSNLSSSKSSSQQPNRRKSTGTSTSTATNTNTNFNSSESRKNPFENSTFDSTRRVTISDSNKSSINSTNTVQSQHLSKNLSSILNNLPSSAPSSDDDENDDESSLGELSFTSSTCTSSSISSSKTFNTSPTGSSLLNLGGGEGSRSKVNLMNKVIGQFSSNANLSKKLSIVEGVEGKIRLESADDERECAELLLGLFGGH